MKLTKHIIPVDIGSDGFLIINSLNGLIDKVDKAVFNVICKWRDIGNIVPDISENSFEEDLYNLLKLRGYLINNDEEEACMKETIVSALRDKHLAGTDVFNHITFILTYNCNFRCPYCYEEENTAKKEVITPEQIDAAIFLAGTNLKSVGLFGGEPLLPSTRKSIEYLVSVIADIPITITTNGYHLLEYSDLLSSLNILSVHVTLDGEESNHDKRRFLADGSPTFQRIMCGIERCLELSIPIRIRMNIDSSIFDSGVALRSNLIEKFSSYSHLLSFEFGSMLDSMNDEKSNLFLKLYESDKDKDHASRLNRNLSAGRFNPIVNTFTIGIGLKPVYSYCYAHSNSSIIVDPYGNMYSCLVAAGKQQLSIGTYYPKFELNKIGIHTRNIESIIECNNCEYSLLCGGGCPLKLPSYDDVLKPECNTIRNQIHNVLPQVYRINRKAKTINCS